MDNSKILGVELLLHNLSHSDLVFDITSKNLDVEVNSVIARPKFSKFKPLTESVMKRVNNSDNQVKLSKFPIYSRSEKVFLPSSNVPVGFDLLDNPVDVEEIASLRFRQDDDKKLRASTDSDIPENTQIRSVYFPLIAVLIPKWLKSIDEGRSGFKKVLILVSGRGTPMDTAANMSDNSTKQAGRLIEHFVHLSYPDIEVQLVHSTTNLFRYDENIMFVKRELLPVIDSYRDILVESLAEKYKENMRISLSFADGSSARISAINASLRHYRPAYMHFWQLKSFWRELKICFDDIESHSFEEICTEPAVSLKSSFENDPLVRLVVDEVIAFRDHFASTVNDPNTLNDLASFWLRKTRKPVLAVLLVQKEGGQPKLYRGTNMEVSMPTGSLCAERNVIGSALADDITLTRRDLKIIAVYSATMPSSDKRGKSQSFSEADEVVCSQTSVLSQSQNCGGGGQDVCMTPRLSPRITTAKVYNASHQHLSCHSEEDCNNNMTHNHKDLFVETTQIETHPSLQSPSKMHTINSPPMLARSPSATLGKRKIMNIEESKSAMDTTEDSVTSDNTAPTRVLSTPVHTPSDVTNHSTITKTATKTTTLSSRKSQNRLITFEAPPDVDVIPSSPALTQRAVVPVSYTIDVEEGDMNPLKPCGACNEWLKKIAEVNPTMRVVTFTDAKCNGVYIEHVDE